MEIRNDRQKVLAKYKLLIIDEIGYLPTDIQGANLFFVKNLQNFLVVFLHFYFDTPRGFAECPAKRKTA